MNNLRAFIRRNPVMVFSILACAPVWVIVAAQLTDALGLLLSTLAPTLSALILIALTEGRAAFTALPSIYPISAFYAR